MHSNSDRTLATVPNELSTYITQINKYKMAWMVKANIWARSRDTHQLQFSKRHHFKIETLKFSQWFPVNLLNKSQLTLNYHRNRGQTPGAARGFNHSEPALRLAHGIA